MKRIIFVFIFALALFFVSCSNYELREKGTYHGYFVVTIDSADYVVVYGGHGVSGICPKVK